MPLTDPDLTYTHGCEPKEGAAGMLVDPTIGSVWEDGPLGVDLVLAITDKYMTVLSISEDDVQIMKIFRDWYVERAENGWGHREPAVRIV